MTLNVGVGSELSYFQNQNSPQLEFNSMVSESWTIIVEVQNKTSLALLQYRAVMRGFKSNE